MSNRCPRRAFGKNFFPALIRLIFAGVFSVSPLPAQTNCSEGNGPLDTSPPKSLSPQQVIQKLGAAEFAAQQARLHYSFKQDVLLQTLVGKSVTGEFHEVTNVFYNGRGKREEEVIFAAQPSLRGIQLTREDMDDVRIFMPLMLPSDDLPRYNLTYAGQQHVDDLDTYAFHVSPGKIEKELKIFRRRDLGRCAGFSNRQGLRQERAGQDSSQAPAVGGHSSQIRDLPPAGGWTVVSSLHAVR
jgi:hypothetical protein